MSERLCLQYGEQQTMTGSMTVGDVLTFREERRQQRTCPDCTSLVSVRGLSGEYWWTCQECTAVGLGFPTRADALAQLGD